MARRKANKAKRAQAKSTSRAPDAIDIQVGENLRRFRLAECMTLAELAGELGISHQQLQKYETGTNRLSASMLKRAADTLQRPIGIFYDGVETSSAPDNSAREEEAEFFDKLTRIAKDGARRARAGLPPGRNLINPPLAASPVPAGVEAVN